MTDKVFEAHCKKLNQKWKPADRNSAPFQKPEYFDGYMYYGHGQVLVRQKSDHANSVEKLPIPVDNVFERYGMSSAERFEIADVKHFYDMIHPFYAERKSIEFLRLTFAPDYIEFGIKPIDHTDNLITHGKWTIKINELVQPIKLTIDPKYLYDAIYVFKRLKLPLTIDYFGKNQGLRFSSGDLEMLLMPIKDEW